MKDLVFDIPLLRELIAQYLLPIDLFNTVLVSKQWNTMFNPALWREFIVVYESSLTPFVVPYDILKRNASHVQSLVLNRRSIEPIVLPSFPNLLSITIIGTTISKQDREYWKYFTESPNLRKVVLEKIYASRERGDSSQKEDIKSLLDSLKAIPKLKHLELEFRMLESTETVKDVIVISERLDTLHLRTNSIFSMRHDEEPQVLESFRTAICQMGDVYIRDLKIEIASEELENAILIPLLERCKYLERLHIYSISYSSDLRKIENAILDKKLKKFCIEGCERDIKDLDRTLCRIGAGGDQSEGGAKESKCEIEELGIEYRKFTPDFPRIVIANYTQTLTVLHLGSLYELSTLVRLLNGLPKLQSFTSANTRDASEEDVEEMCQLPFVCLELRKFHADFLFLEGLIGRSYRAYWLGSSHERVTEYIFSQIGRLSKLKELGIGSNAHCLTQRNGYLEYLKDLKELRILNLENYANKKPALSIMNVNWMMDHWSKLDTIHFCVRFIPEMDQILGGVKFPSHPIIDEFRKRNPNITLTIVREKFSTERYYIKIKE